MDDLLAMGLRHTGTHVQGNSLRLVARQRPSTKSLAKGLAFQELHREKFQVGMTVGCRVNLKRLADIRMTDLARTANFRRQSFAKPCLSALDGDTALELLVHRLVDNSHSALRQFADYTEAVFQKLTRLEAFL